MNQPNRLENEPAKPTQERVIKELKREISLLQATSINMIDMVGIGPFVTIPLVMGKLGPHFLYAWILGALISFIDAFIWVNWARHFPKQEAVTISLKKNTGRSGENCSHFYSCGKPSFRRHW